MNAAGLKSHTEFPACIPSFVEAVDSPEIGVQIWVAQLDSISSDDMFELSASLDSAEQTRAARFHFERDRQHFIATRGILRCLLAAALKISAREVAFEYGSHGKLAILATADYEWQKLRFNVSHAAGAAMFALAWSREIGIDLEAAAHVTDKGEKLSELAKRILSQDELAVWQSLPDDGARAAAFLRAWTRKEAYVKARGAGLFDKLQEIEVALDAAYPQLSLTIGRWVVHDLPAPVGFAAAVAVEV